VEEEEEEITAEVVVVVVEATGAGEFLLSGILLSR
jgi:hypothetical protein